MKICHRCVRILLEVEYKMHLQSTDRFQGCFEFSFLGEPTDVVETSFYWDAWVNHWCNYCMSYHIFMRWHRLVKHIPKFWKEIGWPKIDCDSNLGFDWIMLKFWYRKNGLNHVSWVTVKVIRYPRLREQLMQMYLWYRINNGNCTEWSAIWSEIKCVITKWHDREAVVRFVITSLISDQNCTTRNAISTLLHSFWNLQAATLVYLQNTTWTCPIL